MDAKLILDFLRDIMANNNKQWFQEHKEEYMAAKAEFERGVGLAIARISTFDPSISHITVKDATYRFYRDTRFSNDKSPYKNHFGAYIAAHGKKALHGGYYIHLEPRTGALPVGMRQLLVAYKYTNRLSQRNNGKYRRMASVCGERGIPEILRSARNSRLGRQARFRHGAA